MAELTLGSLFDGLGGWQLAALHNGVRPVWSSEIEAFPMAITKKHFPNTLQLGDITKLEGADLPPVDIICAGSPCQDLSVAGKRKGLEGERSGLFRKAIDIVQGMRTATNGEYPKFFIWENVPGAFSSNKGADFQAVLEEITKSKIPMPVSGKWAEAGMVRSGKCDIAWRVLDAQYWGVPQRRRRIFLVSDFRDKEFRNTAVLFEPESVQGDIETSGGTQQKSAIAAESSTRSTGNTINNAAHSDTVYAAQPYSAIKQSSVAAQLKAQGGANGGGSESYVVDFNLYDMTHADEAMRPIHGDKANTLTSRMGTGGNQVPVLHYDIDAQKTVRKLTPTELRIYLQEVDMNGATQGIKALYVLWENYGAKKVCEWCIAIMERIQQAKVLQQGMYEKSVSAKTSQGNKLDDSSLPCPEYIADWLLRDMRKEQDSGCAPQRWEPAEQFARKLNESVQMLSHENPSSKEKMRDMQETSEGAWLLRETFAAVQKIWESFNVESWWQTKTIRRLTPLETERLQGLPDSWTDIEFNGKPASDSARYKAIGNGMAQPCADFVLSKVVQALRC